MTERGWNDPDAAGANGPDEAAPRALRDASGRQASAQAGRAAARTTGRLARGFARRVKRAADADGADESGMSPLLGAQALSSAGDTLILVALASTVFFDVPLGQARGRVALYLVLTLMPFSLLVPVAGPLLDRFRHGRRAVLALSAVLRAAVAWQLATSLDSVYLFPLALASLVLSRAYGVARSAAMPRVKPAGLTLVAANARINVASVVASGLGAALGAALSMIGTPWVLRAAALVLLAAGFLAVRLPAHIDEERDESRTRAPTYKVLQGPPYVIQPLVAAVALRALAGFLTIFLAFLLRDQDASSRTIGIAVGAVVFGQLVGTALASRLPPNVTRRLTTASLVAPGIACVAAAVLGGSTWAAVAAGITGVSYSLSKFALDASLQTNVPSASVSGAFTRSETGLQFAFAVGGAIAVATPSINAVGFWIAAAIPVLGTWLGFRARRGLPVTPPLPFLRRSRSAVSSPPVTAQGVGPGARPAGRADPGSVPRARPSLEKRPGGARRESSGPATPPHDPSAPEPPPPWWVEE